MIIVRKNLNLSQTSLTIPAENPWTTQLEKSHLVISSLFPPLFPFPGPSFAPNSANNVKILLYWDFVDLPTHKSPIPRSQGPRDVGTQTTRDLETQGPCVPSSLASFLSGPLGPLMPGSLVPWGSGLPDFWVPGSTGFCSLCSCVPGSILWVSWSLGHWS